MGYHELAIIGIIVVITLFVIARHFQKKDSSGEAYSNHIKSLVFIFLDYVLLLSIITPNAIPPAATAAIKMNNG